MCKVSDYERGVKDAKDGIDMRRHQSEYYQNGYIKQAKKKLGENQNER